MQKQEAADFLGVKLRTLELYSQQGKLSVTYTKGKRGRVAQFNEDELKALKEELEAQTTYPTRALVAMSANGNASNASLARPADLANFMTSVAQLVRPAVAIENKPLLTLKECALLTGLSRDFLRAAIQANKLKGQIIGKGWRVKRIDLDHYIQKL